MNESDAKFVAKLQEASRGLLWISESEAPFEVICLDHPPIDELTPQVILKVAQSDKTAPVEEVDVHEFFDYPTQLQDWFGESETAIAHQYKQLADLLETHLTQLKVYRIGAINLEIYIIGQTESGCWAGLTTKAVET